MIKAFAALKPNEVSDKAWKAIIEAWENGLSDREAAFRASKVGEYITAKDIKSWIAKNPEIGELKANFEAELRGVAKDTVADSLRDGDIKTAKWYLERKAADEFSTKAAIEFENAVPVSLEDKEQALKQMIENFESNAK